MSLRQHLEPTLHTAHGLIQRYPKSALLSTLAVLTIPRAWRNYKAYLALGPGGVPYNPFGWLISLAATAISHETLSTRMYNAEAQAGEGYLEEGGHIPERRGDRPMIGWHCLPHRQINKIPTIEVQKALDAIVEKHITANHAYITVVPSPHEKLNPGVIIHPEIASPHVVADIAKREIFHVHPSDHSLHVVLSPRDCKLVIEKGYGERHGLSGSPVIPKEYLLIYAPRDEEELAIVERIIVASLKYMTGTKNIV